MSPKQLMNKSTVLFFSNRELTVENDDIQHVSTEHKDGQAIIEYDPTWYDTTNSDENESDSNDEYKKPTYNDSDPNVVVGYTSFGDHNESHAIDEPTEARPFKEFYELLEVNP